MQQNYEGECIKPLAMCAFPILIMHRMFLLQLELLNMIMFQLSMEQKMLKNDLIFYVVRTQQKNEMSTVLPYAKKYPRNITLPLRNEL